MNKLFLFVLSFLFLFKATPTDALTFEVRAGAFFPADKHVRNLYGKVLPSFQVEVGTQTCTCFDLWANFDYWNKRGHAGHSCCKTRAEMFNGSIGVKYVHTLCGCASNIAPYVGIGPVLGNIWLRNKPCFCSDRTDKKSKLAFGGIVKTGVYIYFCDGFFADLFVDYLYQPVKFHNHRRNLGGLQTGAGLGLSF